MLRRGSGQLDPARPFVPSDTNLGIVYGVLVRNQQRTTPAGKSGQLQTDSHEIADLRRLEFKRSSSSSCLVAIVFLF